MRLTLFCLSILATLLGGGTAVRAMELSLKPLEEYGAQAKTPAQKKLLKWKWKLVNDEFPYTEKQALKVLGKAYPGKPEKKLKAWLAEPGMTYVRIKGKKRYFVKIVENICFRHPDLIRADIKGSRPFYDQLQDIVFAPARSNYPSDWAHPYVNPVTYRGKIAINIPRKKLPKKGKFEVWAPLPIATSSQKWPRVLSVDPKQYLTTVPRTDGDIGQMHFAFPLEKLEKLEKDLAITVEFSFSHYQQRFQVVPGKVLPYHKGNHEYRQYTRSFANTAFTPAIGAKAREIVGSEKNPYLAAQRIYRYIVNNIPYSLVPHGTVQILGLPESIYVHQGGHGDCGAQSMYFSALCRSLGIPARSTGGYQAIPVFSGTHFWAEFYVEGYGWLPVDPTVAETADWTDEISEQQRRTFKDFFFGNLDPYRFVIQKDVDIPLTPRPSSETILAPGRPMFVLQSPVAVCTTCSDDPLELVEQHTSITYEPVDK